ncbi:DUF6362 family protein [Roseomonas xinghualingensis]|uniref:DUF6362 family protein n=1 Tax=Roseomonas xinghualingensis TaxID=2986475 RepID=UPI0021F2087B|nr:DUF6362 family protein [Roseomonas sp. SXEYE001]MCV4206895.1 DUF6362 family protein [Roseomonas sp. SXEYE001]
MSRTPSPALRELPEAIYDAEVVEFRLQDAGATLLALPGRGCFPAGYRTNWPQVVVDVADAAPFREEDIPIPPPTAKRITQMDEAFGWLRLLPADKAEHRRIILLRSLTSPRHGRHLHSWRKIGEMLSLEHRTVQRRFAEGIGWITAELYKQQLGGVQWAFDWQRLRQVAGSLNPKTLVPEEPPVPASLARAQLQGDGPILVKTPETRALEVARYVQLMSSRSRAALMHFPADGSVRPLAGGRGFGEREVVVLEMAGLVGREGEDGQFRLTSIGIQAQGMIPRGVAV